MSNKQERRNKKRQKQKHVEVAHRRQNAKFESEFREKLNGLLKRLGVGDFVPLLRVSDYMMLFRLRSIGIRIGKTGIYRPKLNYDKTLKRLLDPVLKDNMLTFNEEKITAYETLFYLDSLRWYLSRGHLKIPAHLDDLKARMDKLCTFLFESLYRIMTFIDDRRSMISMYMSVPGYENFLMEGRSSKESDTPLTDAYNSATIKYNLFYKVLPVYKYHLTIDGIRRICNKLEFVDIAGGLNHVKIPAEKFGKDSPECLEVFVQVHALIRYVERVDCMMIGVALAFICMQLLTNAEVQCVGDNKYLVSAVVNNVRIGYFVATIVKDKIVFKTFLLVTNTSTPEGNRFDEITGLRKLDKSHLKLDRLSTFFKLKADDESDLAKAMTESGLEHLLHISEGPLRSFYSNIYGNTWTDRSEEIAIYLKKEDDLIPSD